MGVLKRQQNARLAFLVHGTTVALRWKRPAVGVPNNENASRKTKMYHGFKYVDIAGVNISGRR